MDLSNCVAVFRNRDYIKSIELSLILLKADPNNVIARAIIAASYEKTGSIDKAIYHQEVLLESDKSNADLIYTLGNFYFSAKRYRDSIKQYELAISIRSNFAEAYHNGGVAFRLIGNLQKSEQFLTKAISIKSNYAQAHVSLGTTLHELGKYEESKNSYKRAIALQASSFDARYNFGLLLSDIGEWRQAISQYAAAIELNAEFSEGYHQLGLAYIKVNEEAIAEQMLRRAIQLDISSVGASVSLASLLRDSGREIEANSTLMKAHRHNPKLTTLTVALADSFSYLGEYLKAVSHYEAAIKQDSPPIGAFNNFANCLMKLGRLTDAVAVYNRGLKHFETKDELLLNLAMTHDYLNESKLAIFYLKQAANADNEDVSLTAKIYLALFYYLENRIQSVKDLLEQSTDIEDKYSAALRPFLTYRRLLTRLVPLINVGEQSISTIKGRSIFIVGESHSLSAHGAQVCIDKQQYVCKALLVMGCKQWHLSSPTENQFKSKIRALTKEIPKGATVIYMLGEIDCRLDTGILPYSERHPELKISEIVQKTITGYLDFISELCRDQRFVS